MDLNLVVMICLLGAARCSAGDGPCPCPQIPPRPLTLPPSSQCSEIGERFRYSCVEGYVRKAGTSSLTVCEAKSGVASWRNASLVCIPDPNRPTTKTTQPNTTQGNGVIISSTVTAPSSNLPMTQSIYIPASVALQTESREPTSPGQQVLPDVTVALDGTTPPSTTPPSSTPPSTTPAPSCKPTVNARVSNLSQSTTVGLAAALLVIICVCVGLSCFFYKRRRRIDIPEHTNEEAMSLSMTVHVSSIPATTATVGL